MGQKRKRLALSCVDCRRRKVKCDRTYPVCIRCQKSNNTEHCTYVSHTGLDPELPTPSDDSPENHHGPPSQVAPSGEPYVLEALREMSPHMEVQSRQNPPEPSVSSTQPIDKGPMRAFFGRTAQFETHARSPGKQPVHVYGLYSDTPDSDPSNRDSRTESTLHFGKSNPSSDFSKVMVRGSSFSTHYYGPSFAISMLLQFEELSRFVKGMLNQAPSFGDIKERMSATRASTKRAKKRITDPKDTDFKGMVPNRAMADKLVEQYLVTFENTYRILHVPTFRRDYEAYWQNPADAKTEFVVLLLLAMSTVYTVVPGGPEGFFGRESARREVALNWINACESWLDGQSHKHVALAHFQGHVLVFVGKAMNCIKIKREWTATGSLLRFGMAIGMHREPSLLSKKIDVFDQEMRRRLWFTIVELDLLTTIARGMPPTIDSFSWDCYTPRNIDDEDFDQQSTQLPASKSRSTFTRSSFLHVATESLPLRVEILGRINSVRIALDMEGVVQYDDKLRVVIESLPTWKSDNSTSYASSLSKLLLYDYILALHTPFANQNQHRSKAFYSTASKRDISFKTLQIYAKLPEHEQIMLADMRDDYCRATLTLVHDMTTALKTDILPQHEQVLSCIANVVDMAGKRFDSLGQGFHTFWITLSAYSLLQWKLSGAQSSQSFAVEAANRVADLFQQILQKQVPMPLPNGDMPSTEVYSAMSVPSVSVSESLGSFDNSAFPGFDQINLFDDPFADMNFDLATVWNLDQFNEPEIA